MPANHPQQAPPGIPGPGDRRQRVAGVTLIELITALTVAALLTAIAAPSFSRLMARQRARAASTDLFLAMTKTRSEAVKRNANATLAPTSGSTWEAGWQISVGSGASVTILESHAAVKGITITQAPSNLIYQTSGRIKGGGSPFFLISAPRQPTVNWCVSADPSGRPYTKDGPCS